MYVPLRRAKLLFIGLVVLSLTPTDSAAQEEPFAGASPSFEAAPEDAAPYNVGDWGVAEERGAATYTVSLDVPPGRNGMAPNLVLRYSSQSPRRGSLAAGWTLDLPSVEVDRSPGYEDGQTFYKASLPGHSGPLVEVPDRSPYDGAEAYRIRFDNTFTRIFRRAGNRAGWTALSPDGVRHHFEVERGATDLVSIWNITRQVDPFGNTVRYYWQNVHTPGNERIVVDHSVRRIEYTANESAGLSAHAKIEFEYGMDRCAGSMVPVGAASEPGHKTPGAGRLDAINIFVRDAPDAPWRLSRTVSFSYTLRSSRLFDADPVVKGPNGSNVIPCKQLPVRYLTRIDRTAYGPDGGTTSLPPLTFEYNMRTRGPYTSGGPILLPPNPFGDPPDPSTSIETSGHGHSGTQKGAVGTLLDLDGDGILDQVSVIEDNRVCTLVWRKGTYGGGFEANVRMSPLPTAPWYRETLDPPQPQGALLALEGCNVNGQVAYRPRPVAGALEPQAEKGRLAYRFVDYTGDGRVDLLTTVWAPFAHESYEPEVTVSDSPVPVSAPAPPDNQPPSGPNFLPMTPEKISSQEFVWRVYRNAADPESINPSGETHIFSEAFMEVHAPVALPPTVSDEKLADFDTFPISVAPLLFDVDGDGFLDVIDDGRITGFSVGSNEDCRGFTSEDPSWCVYFGNGSSEFAAGYEWPVPNTLRSQDVGGVNTEADGRRHILTHTRVSLRDINGNGLPDLVVREEDNRLRAYLNYGRGFNRSPIDLGRSDPVEVLQTDQTPTNNVVLFGRRGYRRRLIDLDGDGLRDLIFYLDEDDDDRNNIHHEHQVMAAFNAGHRFLPAVELPAEWRVAKRLFTAESGNWWVETDFVDVTGDGLSDMVTWTDAHTMEVVERPGLPAAPDRLSAVANGRGLRVEFTYASTSDVDAVTGNPKGNRAHLPAPEWVVTEIRTTAGHGTPKMVRRYRYADPAFLSTGETSSHPEAARFLGFRRTSITTYDKNDRPAQKIVKRFLYQELLDEGGNFTRQLTSPSGALAEQWTYLAEDGSFRLHRHVENTWQRESLFDGRAYFVHLQSGLTRTCRPGISDVQCMAQSDNVHRREETWVPVDADQDLSEVDTGGDGPALLYVRVRTQRGSGLSVNLSDRRTDKTYTIRYGQGNLPADDYRIQILRTVEQEARPGDNGLIFEARGRTETVYDHGTGLPIETLRWQDASTPAVTRRTYDAQTGNVQSRTKPVQASASGSGAHSTFAYDAHRLFVTTIINELGQETHIEYDVATGATVERRGPNAVTVDEEKVWEREAWTIDGLGRTVAHYVALDDADEGYALELVGRTEYHDRAFVDGGDPVSVRAERLRDFGNDVWVTREQQFDGLGRVLRETQTLADGQQAVTVYEYDGRGNLAAIEAPDPRTDDGSRVRSERTHDGLGRMTRLTRPDSTGIAVQYAGLERTIREITGDHSGSTRRERRDVFGRLVEVRERDPEAGDAVTRYRYDVHDNLRRIVNADGDTTLLRHDWHGNRTAITRGERTWTYAYDLNGNLVREGTPVPEDATSEAHTTAYTYDALDRVTSLRFVDGQSGQPAAAPTSLDTIRYVYDEGPNGEGRLRRVELPFGQVSYTYNARGLVAVEERSFTLNGTASMSATRRVEREYNALDLPTTTTWDDGQQWRVTYDARGLVDTVAWLDPETSTFQPVASYTRALAGPPRTRNSAFGQVRAYGYDALGRPITDTVRVDGTPITTRAYDFNDAGDLTRVTGETDGVAATAHYTYDAHHRLETASGPNGYDGAFTYSPAGNLRTAAVTWNGSDETRHVRYEYGDVDPQAADRLVNVDDGEVYADFTYDPAGNMTARNTPEGTMTLRWNGLDQLRKVEGPDGDEVYYYDHEGQRMLAVGENEVRFWFAERETHYDLEGQQRDDFLHLSGTGPTLARVKNGTGVELQYADALQNLMFALDETGDVTARFLYGPFGEVVDATGEDDHRRQFNGKEHDAISGLRYYGFRYYDPLTLRWNSADPLYRFVPDLSLGSPQRMNLYTFSSNNPMRYYDPDGLAPKPECKKREEECADERDEKEDDEADEDDEKADSESVDAKIKQCTNQRCVDRVLIQELIKNCRARGYTCIAKARETEHGTEIVLTEQGKNVLNSTAAQHRGALVDFLQQQQRDQMDALMNPRPTAKNPPPPVSIITMEEIARRRAVNQQILDNLRGNIYSFLPTGIAHQAGASPEVQAFVGMVGNLVDGWKDISGPSNNAPRGNPDQRPTTHVPINRR